MLTPIGRSLPITGKLTIAELGLHISPAEQLTMLVSVLLRKLAPVASNKPVRQTRLEFQRVDAP